MKVGTMLIAGIALVVILCLIPIIWLFSGSANNDKKLLNNLGLVRSWSKDKSTAFYNWGWRKQSGERVWGERVVKEAFRKANIWLSPEDLIYFEDLCNSRQQGQTINHDKVVKKVESIIRREESLENKLTKMVNSILSRVTTVTEQEATKVLAESGVNLSGKERVIQRFGSNELRKVVSDAGYQILSGDAKGFEFSGGSGGRVYTMSGMEGWERWFKLYKEICIKLMSSKKYKPHSSTMRALIASIRGGLFKDFENDIGNHRHFISSIAREIENKKIAFTLESIYKIEEILYTWHFSPGVTFGGVDHIQLRDLLIRKDLLPMFREFILKNINSTLQSFCRIINYLPLNVIFYGENGYASAYAAEQYSLHLDKFIPVISKLGGKATSAPILIAVSIKDIENSKAGEEVVKPWERDHNRKSEGDDELPDSSNLPINRAIDNIMNTACRKAQVERDSADERGWIIILPIDESARGEFSALDAGPFQLFKRISCETSEPIDFMNNAPGPKQMRLHFFNKIMEGIIRQASSVASVAAADNPLFVSPAPVSS